jgi:hypothetical protein
MFDPTDEQRAEAEADAEALWERLDDVKSIRDITPRNRTTVQREKLRALAGERQEVGGDLPTREQFKQSIAGCRVWPARDPDDTRTLEQWFKAKPRADQGWAWVDMPAPADPLGVSQPG